MVNRVARIDTVSRCRVQQLARRCAILESILEDRAALRRDERRQAGNARELTEHRKMQERPAALDRVGVVPDGLATTSRHRNEERRIVALGKLQRKVRLLACEGTRRASYRKQCCSNQREKTGKR